MRRPAGGIRGPARSELAGLLAAAVLLAVAAWPVAGAARDDAPVIVDVRAPPRLRVGAAGEIRLTYRAPRGDIVAVVQTVEDVDGPGLRRSTRQRRFDVIARAFGREEGELALPLAFETPGRKRVVVALVTDEAETSDPAEVEVEAVR